MCEKKIRYVVAATTIWSGASYVYTKDAVRILTAARQRGVGEKGGKKGERWGSGGIKVEGRGESEVGGRGIERKVGKEK